MKTAFLTGYTGMDGTFLTRYLLDQGYKVVGLVRRISTEPPHRMRGKFDFTESLASGQLVLEQGDLLSRSSLDRIIYKHAPDEVYNLGAQSHVGLSFEQPEISIEIGLMGTVNLISALEANQATYSLLAKTWKFYQASTSEMFGNVEGSKTFNEQSELRPNSPYAIAKTAAHYYCAMKRREGKFICSGILFNHESEIRGGNFVTQKIARGVAKYIKDGIPLELGNLNAGRDWGYAWDYIKAMHLMLQQDKPDDYVVATGVTHTVREFVEKAFECQGYEIVWSGEGKDEIGMVGGTLAVAINPKFYRPADVNYLKGNASKIMNLGWKPEVEFDELVKRMVTNAIDESKN